MRSPVPVQAVLSACAVLILIAGILSSGCADLPGLPGSPSHEGANSGDLRVYFLDVGQGDSSLILFRDTVILIDAGDVDMGERVVSDLKKLGADHIDLLVATHPHSDHIGGMPDVLAAFPVGEVLDTALPHTSPVYEHFLATVREQDIRYTVAEPGLSMEPDPSLALLVLSPPAERPGDDLNANSIILKVSYGAISFLFTGDAGDEAEQGLLRNGLSPQAEVLKVAHHGSTDATSSSFLSRVRPEVAVLSLGTDNPYGHPHTGTLDALQAAVPAIYRTDRDGMVLIRSDGISYSVTTENGQGGIWVIPVSPSPTTSPGTAVPSVTPQATPSAAVTLPVLPVVPVNVTIPALPAIPSPLIIPVPSVSIPSLQIGNASFLKIDAVRFDAPGDDRVNLNGEWVRIANRGDGVVLITGWTLSDRYGADPYTFPAFLLLPRRSVTVYTGSGVMNDTALFMGRTEPLWGNSGDQAILKDGSGTIIDRRAEGGLS
jgi:competence protein ComEC